LITSEEVEDYFKGKGEWNLWIKIVNN
jgi:hypothetical protein